LAQRTGETLTETVINALLLAKLIVDIAAVTANHADIASRAFQRCFAYAVAKDKSAPLLFKGDDFGRTDVMVAPY
jgi:ribonuclease VapC